MKLTLKVTPQELLLIRGYVWNTRLKEGNDFDTAAFNLARYFERNEEFINALLEAYGEPELGAELDEYGATFTIAR